MTCKHPSCLRDAEWLIKVRGREGGNHVDLVTSIAVCGEHVPSMSEIGSRIKGFIRARMREKHCRWPVFEIIPIDIRGDEAKAHFSSAPN